MKIESLSCCVAKFDEQTLRQTVSSNIEIMKGMSSRSLELILRGLLQISLLLWSV